jgi:cell division protein FtsI/penicillin-binding protein 2
MRFGWASLAFVAILAIAGSSASAKQPRKVATTNDVDLSSIEIDGGRARAPRRPSGDKIGLTLDPDLQRAAHRALVRSRAPSGAVVVSDVRTGRVLAWVALGNEGDLVRRAKYPGASLFKVITSAALLENEVKPGTVVCYRGGESRLHEEDLQPGCHGGDQRIRFDKALGKSINAVFGKLALAHLDEPKLSSMALAFGIGAAPPLDLPSQATSTKIPADKLGLARAAAGFGDSRMSPLAALDVMQTIANKGERIRLSVTGSPDRVKRVSLGRVVEEDTAEKLVRMLEVTTRAGTSAKAFAPIEGKPDVSVAGKTGTLAYENPKRLVSWFAGFAPSRDPEIAVAVLLANDNKWWKKANEVAREVLDAHFEKRLKK